MFAQTSGLAFREALRRPGFHALRIVSMAGFYAIHGESSEMSGNLEPPEFLPAASVASRSLPAWSYRSKSKWRSYKRYSSPR
jgi:hypothetical protein